MEVFGQYAATRLLHTHRLAVQERTPVMAGASEHREEAVIYTWAGVDLVTGMPVLVYSLPGQPPSIKAVYSEFLPAVLETGERDEIAYVVAAFAPGYVPIKPGLSESRLRWLARSSARALFDAHVGGLAHGDLQPEHFYAQGEHLIVAGFGLPWADEKSAYRAPEGTGEFPADVYAWARCVQFFAGGNPDVAIPGELGRLVGHCLHMDPRERPTAGELVLALEQVLTETTPPAPKPEPEAVKPEDGVVAVTATTIPVPPSPVFPTTTTPEIEARPVEVPVASEIAAVPVEPEPPAPPVVVPAPRPPEPVRPAARATPPSPEPVVDTHPLREPEGMEADEPDVPIIVRANRSRIEDFEGPYRPNWNEEISVPAQTPRRGWWGSRLLWGMVLLGLLVAMLFTLLSRNPATGVPEQPLAPVRPAPTTSSTPDPTAPATNFVVNFEIEGGGTQKGRLIVVTAPPESGLKVGDMLANVPGPVLFTAAGQYTLQIAFEGFEAKTTEITVPSTDNRVILQLR